MKFMRDEWSKFLVPGPKRYCVILLVLRDDHQAQCVFLFSFFFFLDLFLCGHSRLPKANTYDSISSLVSERRVHLYTPPQKKEVQQYTHHFMIFIQFGFDVPSCDPGSWDGLSLTD